MTRDALLVVVVLVAPLALVALVALFRGYDLTVVFRRRRGPRKGPDE